MPDLPFYPLRRTVLKAMAGFALGAAGASASAAPSDCGQADWPAWQAWASAHVQPDGRVLHSSLLPNHTTSEGQSYNLLLSLIANDAQRFEQIWSWTRDNMMAADAANRLPGWLWGQGADGKWQLQDANSASDADLWIAYALLEAARLWKRPTYRSDALRLLDSIEARLVVDLPGLGKMVLPGPQGFSQRNQAWTLNPSYLPLPLLRRLHKERPKGPWQQIAGNTVRMIQATSPKGYVADWVGYKMSSVSAGQFMVDPAKGELGSYDAIRVYLWAGMTSPRDPDAAALLAALDGMRQAILATGAVPEKVKVTTGAAEGQAPFGFGAAMLPYLQAKGEAKLAALWQARATQQLESGLAQPATQPEILYYNVMLGLFGIGWAQQRYQFRDDGTLNLSWEKSCARAVPR
ncbi:cellulose synthase complex periplasmic endoglucanase BcsZ [Herbaspirillum aquaticum]|jgi:endoglucanase|uniref:cellulose synthase complex periplasmic endoglucanase BcsZ n=1 Tax=Herbaspirillum aquaticum TaxID=568783 RepID=UPI001C7061F8|nr:cellulose synthase complex periplasmic endoglucanase BcsZ [Herbaspirillum aquaticum]MBW9333883.1 cellulase [Herbaspirillum sp. RU 5E]